MNRVVPHRVLGLAIVAIYAALVLWPYVAVGPNDLEEFFTGIIGTKLAVQAIMAGQWPFWSVDIGLGVPLPLKYHFITHPASGLCLIDDCQRAMRIAAALQIVIGALCMALILRATGIGRSLSTVGALAFLVTSSTIEDTYVNDWSSTALAEASIPILIYAALRLFAADDRRDRVLWTLVFGGVIGFLLSMGYPAPQFMIVGLFLLARPSKLWERRDWFALAAAVALCIGGAHLYHLTQQILATPPTALRSVHDEASPLVELWSTFLRPFGGDLDKTWRIIFLGPPFAMLATLALFRRTPALWPYQFGLVASVALMLLPEGALFNLVTARWFFRAGVNIFGIVLATHLLASFLTRFDRRRTAVAAVAGLVVLQLAWQWWAFLPLWRSVAQVALGGSEPDSNVRRLSLVQPAVAQLQALNAARPGRLMFSDRAGRAIRSLNFTADGIAPNVFAIANIPTVSAFAHGIVLDPLYPTEELTGGPIWPPASAHTDQAFLDVLGIRYLLMLQGEQGAPGLREIGSVPGGLTLFENPGAWPEAFTVDTYPSAKEPRKAGCEHDRFLCADFSAYQIHRLTTAVGIDWHHDGMTLRVPKMDRPQRLVVTQWYQPDWHVSSGRASLGRVIEQFIGVTIAPGETSVRLTYFPAVRGALFVFGCLSELAVAGVCVAMAVLIKRRPRER